MMRRASLIAAFALIALAGCSDSDDDPTTTTVAAQSATTTTVAPTSSAAPTTTTTAAPTTTTTTTEPPQAPEGLATLALAFEGATPIEVVVTGTTRPRFDWTSSASADRYMTIVVADDGTVLWSWEGEGETVTVGSGEVDRDGLGGRLVRPGWLIVLGFGGDGAIVAVSDTIPVGA